MLNAVNVNGWDCPEELSKEALNVLDLTFLRLWKPESLPELFKSNTLNSEFSVLASLKSPLDGF